MTVRYLLQRDSAARAARNLDSCRLWLIFCNLQRSRLMLGLRIWKGTKNLAGELSSARFKIPESPIRVAETSQLFFSAFVRKFAAAFRAARSPTSVLWLIWPLHY